MLFAYENGGAAKVLEILDDDNQSVRDSFISKRGSVLTNTKRESLNKIREIYN